MNISTHTYRSVAELHIKADAATLEEDVTYLENGDWRVEECVIQDLVTASMEFSEFNERDAWEWFKEFVIPNINREQKQYMLEELEKELGE